jgi:hypothetical protein
VCSSDLALPDLQGVARAAMERVVERAEAAPATAPAPAAQAAAAPTLPEVPHTATVVFRALPPAPPPGSGTAPPVPGVWRAPAPPPPGWAPAPRAEVAPEERDLAQRIGDRLYPLVERLRDSRLSWFAVVALFGITVPIIVLRQSFDVRVRLVLSAVTFFFWLGLIQDIL